jgi:transcriptional regulator with XRE-family HTH domain
MTQSELAQKIGITTSSVGMYETGVRHPSYEVLYKLSEIFNVSIDYLLGKSEMNSGFDKAKLAEVTVECLALEKKFYKMVFSELFNESMRPSINTNGDDFPNVVIELSHNQFSQWFLEFKNDISEQSLLYLYGQIALIEFKRDQKLTIAVSREEDYLMLISKPPKSIRVNLYVMLVDLDFGIIIKEEKLCQF